MALPASWASDSPKPLRLRHPPVSPFSYFALLRTSVSPKLSWCSPELPAAPGILLISELLRICFHCWATISMSDTSPRPNQTVDCSLCASLYESLAVGRSLTVSIVAVLVGCWRSVFERWLLWVGHYGLVAVGLLLGVGHHGLVAVGRLIWIGRFGSFARSITVGRFLCVGRNGSIAILIGCCRLVAFVLSLWFGRCGLLAVVWSPWFGRCGFAVVLFGRCGLVAIDRSLCRSVAISLLLWV